MSIKLPRGLSTFSLIPELERQLNEALANGSGGCEITIPNIPEIEKQSANTVKETVIYLNEVVDVVNKLTNALRQSGVMK